jgi:hypothetical protein
VLVDVPAEPRVANDRELLADQWGKAERSHHAAKRRARHVAPADQMPQDPGMPLPDRGEPTIRNIF